MTLLRIPRPITCIDSSVCSVEMMTKIEVASGLKLHADVEGEVVDGYMSIIHKPGNHLVIVCFYDQGTHEYVDASELQEFSRTGVVNERVSREHKGIVTPNARIAASPPNKGQIISILNAS